MLCGKDFRRCHYGGLIAVFVCKIRTRCCHGGFSAAHIALNQAVHGYTPTHIPQAVVNGTALGAGQFKRQACGKFLHRKVFHPASGTLGTATF